MQYDIKDLRKSLDIIDQSLILLLAERFRVTDKVGHYKKEMKLPPVDSQREQLQFKKIEELAAEVGVNPDFAHKMLRTIIDEVVTNHKKIIGE